MSLFSLPPVPTILAFWLLQAEPEEDLSKTADWFSGGATTLYLAGAGFLVWLFFMLAGNRRQALRDQRLSALLSACQSRAALVRRLAELDFARERGLLEDGAWEEERDRSLERLLELDGEKAPPITPQ